MGTVQQDREALTNRTFRLMLQILVIFGVPAGIAFFVGRWIDTTYDIRPNGTLAVLGVSFVLSWGITIMLYRKISREFKELEKREQEEQKEK